MTMRLMDRKVKRSRHTWEPEPERCVVCGAETPYRRSTPVGLRADYMEGIGQLCCRCAEEFRNEELQASRNGFAYALPYYVKTETL